MADGLGVTLDFSVMENETVLTARSESSVSHLPHSANMAACFSFR